MNCRKCGNVLMEGAKFCTVCGTPIENVDAPVAPPVAAYATTSTTYAASLIEPTTAAMAQGVMLDSSPRATALSMLKNPITLIMGILWLVLTVMLFEPFVDSFEAFEYIDRLEGIQMLAVFAPALFFAQTLVCGIGFIMAFAKARQNQLGGTGAIKGGFIITFVIFAIVTLFIILGIAEVEERYSEARRYGYTNSSFMSENAMELILTIAIIVILFVSIAQVISSFTTVETAVRNDKSYKKTSVFAAVISFLVAAVLLYVVAESGVMEAESDEATMVMFMFLASIAICVLLGVMLIMFRKIGMPVAAPVAAPSFAVSATPASPAPFTVPTTAASTTQNVYGQGVNNGYQQPIPDLNVNYQQPVPDLNVNYQQPVPDLNVNYQQPVPDLNVNYQQPVSDLNVNYQQPMQTATSNYQQPVQNVTANYQQPVKQVRIETMEQPETVTAQVPVSQVNTTGFQQGANLDDVQMVQNADVENRVSVQNVQEPEQNGDAGIPMN